MPEVFRISPDDQNWGINHSYIINAFREYYVPAVSCSECNATWATTGVIYPTVDYDNIKSLAVLLKPMPVSLETYKEIYHRLLMSIGTGRLIMPGTELGPLSGTAKGEMGDFSWVNPWTPLIRESVLSEFNAREINLTVAETKIKLSSKIKEKYLEIEAIPLARVFISHMSQPQVCQKCGRTTLKPTDSQVIALDSIDMKIPVQRCQQLPTMILVNEKFANAVRDLKLSNIVLEPVELR